MFGNIRIDPGLLKEAREHAEKAGYPDVNEFIEHLIEKELEKSEGNSDEDVKKQLEGLGYIS